MARSVATCLAVLLALFEIGSCTRCYQCNSQSDPNCKDPFTQNEAKTVDCSSQDSIKYNQQYLYNLLPSEVFGSVVGSPRYCHKIIMGSGTIIRACLDGNPNDMKATCTTMINNSQAKTAGSQVSKCEVCGKDNCNGASSLTFSVSLSVVTLLASYLVYKQ